MNDSQAAIAALSAKTLAAQAAADQLRKEKAELSSANDRLSKELKELSSRLEFVEDIVGPTETQRKKYQVQLVAAREAAVRVAHTCPSSVPTRCVGRLDERWLQSKGLTPAECTMLQRGCVTGENGVPCDISLLGDPAFSPYDRETLEPNWEWKGGFLGMSLGDIRAKWGEEVALEVLRCAIELDKYDASRRLGVELPWDEKENREMEPSEIISLLGQHLSTSSHGTKTNADADEDEDSEWGGLPRSEMASPDDVGDGAGVSRAWFMLEAMMSDLGLNQMSLLAPPAIPASAESVERQRNEVHETDEDVVAEALEEDHLAELQRQAIAEQEIQQAIAEQAIAEHYPEAVAPSSLQLPESSNQHKSGASTPSTGTPVARTRCTTGAESPSVQASISAGRPSHGSVQFSSGGMEVASSVAEGEAELALPHEVSTNEALFLSLLQDEMNTNLGLFLSAEAHTPSSSTDRSTN